MIFNEIGISSNVGMPEDLNIVDVRDNYELSVLQYSCIFSGQIHLKSNPGSSSPSQFSNSVFLASKVIVSPFSTDLLSICEDWSKMLLFVSYTVIETFGAILEIKVIL